MGTRVVKQPATTYGLINAPFVYCKMMNFPWGLQQTNKASLKVKSLWIQQDLYIIKIKICTKQIYNGNIRATEPPK